MLVTCDKKKGPQIQVLGPLPELGDIRRDDPDQLHAVEHVTQLEADRMGMEEAERLAWTVEESPEDRRLGCAVGTGESDRVGGSVVAGRIGSHQARTASAVLSKMAAAHAAAGACAAASYNVLI